mmetsp:Transcript_36685/g.56255  ORF Transcript_36685/g.56255 Transcript_36685/m.56255 type:complete len:97 (-) Transcript_36685:80-370(-)
MDLMIVIGTALAVPPFSNTVEKGSTDIPRVLINLENTSSNGYDFCDILNFPQRTFIEGKCDEIVCQLVVDVGWEDEFLALLPPKLASSFRETVRTK